MIIRPSTKADVPAMLALATELTDWFGKPVIDVFMPVDFVLQRGLIAEDSGPVVGFLTYISDHAQVQIIWFGISHKYHGKGIGSKLLATLEDELRSIGVTELRLNTIAESFVFDGKRPFISTHAFYKKKGFVIEKEFKPAPSNDEQSLDMVTFYKHI